MREIKKIGVAGAGTMGVSMAETFAEFGYEVILYDIYEQALTRAKENMEEKHIYGICFTTETTDFRDVDFLVEAVFENPEIKQKFWREVSEIVPGDAVLASNTSGLSISEIAEAVKNPERFAGMHWINPPRLIPLVEVIKGCKTENSTVKEIYTLAENLNKIPVMVKDAPGFALNRIQLAVLRECFYIVEQGIASPEDVDKVMKYALGIRYACLGPFEVADHGGIDIFYNIASYLFADLCSAKEPFGLLKKCFDEGHYGIKTGQGIYHYGDGQDKEAVLYRDRMYTKVSECVLEEEGEESC